MRYGRKVNVLKNPNKIRVEKVWGPDSTASLNVVNQGRKVNVVEVPNKVKVEKVWGPDGVVPGRRRTYTHIQNEPSGVWEVVHNLGSTQVLVEIFTEDGEDLDAYYRIIDENRLVVEVNPPLKGYVVVYE